MMNVDIFPTGLYKAISVSVTALRTPSWPHQFQETSLLCLTEMVADLPYHMSYFALPHRLTHAHICLTQTRLKLWCNELLI